MDQSTTTTELSKTEAMKRLNKIASSIAKEGNTDALEDELDQMEDDIGKLKASGKLSAYELKELEDKLDEIK